MEPMAVSPTKSPSSNQYLPSFLMGEQAPTPGSQTSTPVPAASYARSSCSKVEGPPIVGLFDELSSSPPLHNTSTYLPTSSHHNTSLDNSCFENQENRNYWVRVQGFNPSQVSKIIAFFSQLGRVTEHNYPVNTNWIFFCYANQADMRKALRMDSKVLWGHTMVTVMEMKPQVCSEGGNSISDQTCNNISISSPTSPKIRPLAISKRLNAQSPTAGDRSGPGPVPTADTSLVGKFMDFIFS